MRVNLILLSALLSAASCSNGSPDSANQNEESSNGPGSAGTNQIGAHPDNTDMAGGVDPLAREIANLSPSTTNYKPSDPYTLTAAHVGDLGRVGGLKDLDLTDCGRLDDSALGKISELKKLERLILANTQVGSKGLQELSTLPSLRALDVSFCERIDDTAIDQVVKLASLEELSLVGCSQVTDDAVRKLVKLDNLRRLDLSWCAQLSESAVLEIVQGLPKLEWLGLNHTSLGSTFLFQLQPQSALQVIELIGTPKITAAAATQFEQAHPGVQVRTK